MVIESVPLFMKASSKSEDLLALLFWGIDILIRPTQRNILQSFESWDYQNRLRAQLRQLQRAKLLERHGTGKGRTCHLSELGRLHAGGGVDPVQRWQRRWDGKLRLFIFDLPSRNGRLRVRLWRLLRSERFGYLQLSVWISPDPMDTAFLPLRDFKLTPDSVTVMEASPVAPDTNNDIVKSAWDFALINRRYQTAMELAVKGCKLAESSTTQTAQLSHWLSLEREAWFAAAAVDPFLPQALLPANYLGREAWEQRQATFRLLARRTVA